MRRGLIKSLILALILASLTVLTGAGILTVTLKNADKPFIDLGSEVADSDIGQEGNVNTGLEGQSEEDTVGDVEIAVTIRVRDEAIFLNESTVSGTISLKAKLKSTYSEGMKIFLVDDYAESKTYIDVRTFLMDNGYAFTEMSN